MDDYDDSCFASAFLDLYRQEEDDALLAAAYAERFRLMVPLYDTLPGERKTIGHEGTA